MHAASSIAVVGILVFLAHLFSALFSRTRVPDVLLLMLIGLLLGPIAGLVGPQNFGSVGPFFSTVTLVILLFEGGVSLDLDVLVASFRDMVALTAASFFLAMAAVGAVGYFLLHLQPVVGLMLGAIVASTSPAVIVPLTRKLDMGEHPRSVLLMESALSDVLSIVIALAILAGYQLGKLRVGVLIGQIIATLLLAAILGVLAACFWSSLLRRVRSLENSIFTTPAFVFILFGGVEALGYSGYIAALAFGATLGNIEAFHKVRPLRGLLPARPITLNQTERDFIAEIVFLLAAFFFIYIGISMRLTRLHLALLGLALSAAIMVLRIPAAYFTLSRSISVRDASLISVMTPKGLAAAVLASIPLQEHIPGGDVIQHVTYAMVFFSIVLTSSMTFLVDRTVVGKFYARIFRRFAPNAEAAVASSGSGMAGG